MRGCVVAAVVCLSAAAVLASVDGYPFAENTNVLTWEQAISVYDPFGQIVTAINERCEITGSAALAIAETWTCAAGSSNRVFSTTNIVGGVTNIYWHTNIVLLTIEVTTTNQTGAFTYDYTDPSGSYTATGYPWVTRYFMTQIDNKLIALADSGEFVCTNEMGTNGNYDGWFDKGTASNKPTGFALESLGGCLYRQGIGVTFDPQTNSWGFVTNTGMAEFTRQVDLTAKWLLAEAHYTGAWTFIEAGTFDADVDWWDTNDFPAIVYVPATTNSFGTVQGLVTGLIMQVDAGGSWSSVYTSETVSISSTNETALAHWWNDLQDLECSGGTPSTGDVIALYWTNVLTYGDWPYDVFAEDLDERIVVIHALVHSHASANSGTSGIEHGGYWDWKGYGWSEATNKTWHGAPEQAMPYGSTDYDPDTPDDYSAIEGEYSTSSPWEPDWTNYVTDVGHDDWWYRVTVYHGLIPMDNWTDDPENGFDWFGYVGWDRDGWVANFMNQRQVTKGYLYGFTNDFVVPENGDYIAKLSWGIDPGHESGPGATVQVFTVTYDDAYLHATRNSRWIGVDEAIYTNASSDRQLYLKGHIHHSVYDIVDDAEGWTPEYTPLYTNRFAVIFEETSSDSNEYYNGMVTNAPPWKDDSTVTQRFWAVHSGKWVLKWDL